MLEKRKAGDDHSDGISFSPGKWELGWDRRKMRVGLFEVYAADVRDRCT